MKSDFFLKFEYVLFLYLKYLFLQYNIFRTLTCKKKLALNTATSKFELGMKVLGFTSELFYNNH